MAEDLESLVGYEFEGGTGDPWSEDRGDNYLSKLGRWISCAGIAAFLTVIPAYTFGARWAQDVRAFFDGDYSDRVSVERSFDESIPFCEQRFIQDDFPVFDDKLKYAVYSHIYNRFNESSQIDPVSAQGDVLVTSAYQAGFKFERFLKLLSEYTDCDGEFVSDVELAKSLYDFGGPLFIARSYNSDSGIFKDVDDLLKSHTWDEVAKIVREKYK